MIVKLAENRVYRTYPGGRRLDAFVSGRQTEDGPFPEDWLASTVRAMNPGREDVVEGLGRTAAGVPLADLIPGGLPLLVKLLDAGQRLVVQAHPTRAFAREAWHSPVGKTECWYVLEAEAEACVYIGFQAWVTRADWVSCCQRQDVPRMLAMLHRFTVKKGDCVFVPGGVPHAIGGGCLLLETQEPSDLMVVPERVTPAGRPLDPQKIHGGLGFERMYDCFCYDGLTRDEARRRFFRQPEPLENGFTRYVEGAENGMFSLLTFSGTRPACRVFTENFAIAVVTEGCGVLSLAGEEIAVRRGERLLLLELAGERLTIAPESAGLSVALSLPAAPGNKKTQ